MIKRPTTTPLYKINGAWYQASQIIMGELGEIELA